MLPGLLVLPKGLHSTMPKIHQVLEPMTSIVGLLKVQPFTWVKRSRTNLLLAKASPKLKRTLHQMPTHPISSQSRMQPPLSLSSNAINLAKACQSQALELMKANHHPRIDQPHTFLEAHHNEKVRLLRDLPDLATTTFLAQLR